ncbi:MAG: hypothetical protein AAFO86_09590 [Pseudomonadota bacterium]
MFKKLGLQHPFFLPLWRRVVTVLAITLWGGFELWLGNTGWASFFAILAAICILEFFILFDPENYGGDDA